MTRAALYVRISSDPEGLALGVERQEEDARALAERRGWTVEAVYRDNDVSASGKRRRPGWEQLLEDLEAGKLDAIVGYSSSRFYRNHRDLGRLIDLVNTRRTQIATVVSGNIDLTTADGRMIARMLATTDQAEWERTSERKKRQNRQKVEQAAARGAKVHWAGRRRAFGYSADGSAIERDEAKLIKQAARRIISGESAYRISMDWNAEGITTPYGAAWRPNKLARMLRGEHFTGQEGHPAILSADEHELLVAALAEDPRTGQKRGRGRPTGTRYAALGMLFCGDCGARMYGNHRRYTCSEPHQPATTIDAFTVESYLVAQAAQHAEGGHAPEPETMADVEPLLAQARALDARAAEVEQAIEEGDMPIKAGGRLLGKIEEERAEVQAAIGQALPSRTGRARLAFVPGVEGAEWTVDTAFLKGWKDGTLQDAAVATLHDFLEQFIEAVHVTTANGNRWVPIEDRVTITWR